jgi:hypothetical protein
LNDLKIDLFLIRHSFYKTTVKGIIFYSPIAMHHIGSYSTLNMIHAAQFGPWRTDPYIRPLPRWMREYKQNPAPIFVLVD